VVGGGLAGSLVAFRCASIRPSFRLLILERGKALGGNHTWSFHGSDVGDALAWLRPFVKASWPSQRVCFPRFDRSLDSDYYSIRSQDLHREVLHKLGPDRVRFGAEVTAISETHVQVGSEKLSAKLVLDARGIAFGAPGPFGYQKFLGQDLLLTEPHGLTEPLLMDAKVPQTDGFRFFYLLPWTADQLLVEDTHYSDSPDLDEANYRVEIQRYVEARGWKIEQVLHEEVGSLPIPLKRKLGWDSLPNAIGVRAGLFHPTTGYSFLDAVRSAEWIRKALAAGPWDSGAWMKYRTGLIRNRWFFRYLNRMFFGGVPPHLRYTLIERFYRLPLNLVKQFYSSEMPWRNYLVLLLWGKPPLPISKAVRLFAEPKETYV
jgi:lycopene beta-cyclase